MTLLWSCDGVSCRFVLLSVIFSMFLFSIALISSRTVTPTKSSEERTNDTLKFVIVVTRHGNRGTLETIPNDPYPINNTQFWPYGKGGLTPYGRVQMYNLGLKIRSLYDGFLDTTYDTKDFYASSTAIDRAMISGEAFLSGLYPSSGYKVLGKKFPSQLIPLYSNSPDKTLEAEYCAKVLSIRKSTVARFINENNAVIKGLNEFLSEHSGARVSDIHFFSSWDTIISESTEGFDLPSWMQQIFPQPIVSLVSKFYVEYSAGTNDLTRLIMGHLYKELIGILQSKVGGTLSPNRKMYFYSGHDYTLITLQAILGIPKSSIRGVIKPGSAMIFELHQNPTTEEFFIQVLYIDGDSKDLTPQHLPIPNCTPSCSFHQLVNSTQRFTNISSFELECQV